MKQWQQLFVFYVLVQIFENDNFVIKSETGVYEPLDARNSNK